MLRKYLIVFFVSMVPLIELRGAIPIAAGLGLTDTVPHVITVFIVAILGNMLPVPIIYLFARKVLEWGKDKPVIGKFFTFCLEKGKKADRSCRKRREEVFLWLLHYSSGYLFRVPEPGPERLPLRSLI